MGLFDLTAHRYFLWAEGTFGEKLKHFKANYYLSRSAAEDELVKYCNKMCTKLTCVEQDKHERKYMDSEGNIFYINRV